MRTRTLITASCLCLWVMAMALPSPAQVTPEEHAKHHPSEAAGAMPTTSPAPASGKSGGGGMMEGMGEMMKEMGKPPAKDLYPSLMALPELSPEQRKQVEEQAGERMHAGAALMAAPRAASHSIGSNVR